MLATIVYQKGIADEFRNHRASSGPGLDGFLGAGSFRFLDFSVNLFVDERAFFCDLLIIFFVLVVNNQNVF